MKRGTVLRRHDACGIRAIVCHQEVKRKMKSVSHWRLSLGLLAVPNLAFAVPLKDFMDTSFIGGGVMLFVVGLVMLFIPRMFRWGVLTMLLGDLLFMVRMFFQKDLMVYVTSQGNYGQLIEEMSRDASRFMTILGVVTVVIVLLVFRAVLRGLVGSNDIRQTKQDKRASRQPPAATKPHEVVRNRRSRIDRDLEPAFGQQSHSSEPTMAPDRRY